MPLNKELRIPRAFRLLAVGAIAVCISAVVVVSLSRDPNMRVKLEQAAASPGSVPPPTGSTLAVPAGLPFYLQACYRDQNAIPLKQCLTNGQQRAIEEASIYPGDPTGTKSSLSGSSSTPTTSPYISETEAEHVARSGPGDSQSNPANAELTTYIQASTLIGENAPANPYLSDSMSVWLVTVHGPAISPSMPPGSRGTQAVARPQYFSEIIDAVNGAVIDYCAGCKPLTTS